jgi:hypothetical protein
MAKKIFYEKVGSRYKPVYEYDQTIMDALPKGTHLVQVYPGGKSTRCNIDPAYAPMIAAARVAEDAISNSIMEASKLRVPARDQPLTPVQLKAWKALAKAFGKEQYALEWCSYREAAEAGVKAMQVEADKLLEHPAVRKAYDHFMLMSQLTKESKKNED